MSRTGKGPIRARSRRWLAPAAVLSAAALIAAACGGGGTSSSTTTSSSGGGANTASAPGITPTSITIGSHQPLTGIVSSSYGTVGPAAKAMFDYVNAHGGVNGRKINYNFQDDAYNPTQTATVVRSLVLQDNVFAIFNGLGTAPHLAVQQFLNTNKIPDLFVASGCTCWNNQKQFPYTSGYQTDYEIEGKITGKYVSDHFAGQKVGYLYQDDDFGQGGQAGLNQQIPKNLVVSQQKYVPTNFNVSPQIAALQASGAQVVVLYTVTAFTSFALKAMAQMGYHPQVVVSSVGADPPTLTALLGGSSAQEEGLVTSSYGPASQDTSNPWIQLFQRIQQQYIPNVRFDGNVVYGESVAYTFVKLLQQAGNNPTRQSIINTLKTANLAGPGLVPFGYSSTSNAGYTGVQMGTIHGGTLTLSGPRFISTDTGPINTYNGAPTTPPANF